MYKLAEIALYNLRHHGRTHFCHFSIRKILDSTPIRRHTYRQKKKYKTVKDMSYTYSTVKYDDAKLLADNAK